MNFMPMADATTQKFDGNGLVDLLIVLLVTALFVYVAARIVAGHGSFLAAIGTVLLGGFLFALVLSLTGGGVLGLILAILAWGLVAAVFFRTRWLQGAVIGIVAALLALLVKWVIATYIRHAP